jgi:hypothetical protein
LTDGDAPVYELARGVLAYPDGNVWIRFAENVDAASRAEDVERAGYRIERVPGYAPHAAFVRAATIADSLSNLDALRALAGVEHVEPVMLMDRSFRG